MISDYVSEAAVGITRYGSVLMKAIIISRNLDRKETPDFVLKYAVLEQILEIRNGLRRFTKRIDRERSRNLNQKMLLDSFPHLNAVSLQYL